SRGLRRRRRRSAYDGATNRWLPFSPVSGAPRARCYRAGMEARRVWRIAGEGCKGGALSRETAILVWSATCLFLLGAATVAVTNVGETLFLKRVGVDLLPQVFLANSILLAISTYLVGRRAARADRGRLLTETLTALAVGVLILWAATRTMIPGA